MGLIFKILTRLNAKLFSTFCLAKLLINYITNKTMTILKIYISKCRLELIYTC